ncbi:hypothetical protein LPJ63_002919 [Coemansia sp. RSA 2711]|nr:hypothetical protein LPJ63_002919 [Coemansia sp. RSA 2711]KAJ2361339.1 hypothetical protein H4S01_005313 [Coemansia sp. RSA 2610]KAJ2372225.1 hypothetical protein H4S02_009279 [Coemansia sp. RSA 2611]
MGIASLPLSARSIELGPEDPAEMVAEMYAILNPGKWKVDIALGITGVASGAIVVFLLIVFFWRRALVNRISLRLIFAISLMDFVGCAVQASATRRGSDLNCRVYGFFMEFFIYGSVYLSSSIAFNLQMTFLRSSHKPLPRYTEYLYYAVPTAVGLLQFVPQYIWAAKKGYCRAFDPVQPGTTHYIWYVIIIQLGIPTVFILYNVVTCVLVIISLYRKQRNVSKALKQATEKSRDILEGSHDSSLCSDTTAPPVKQMSSQEHQQLIAVRRVYRACIRIALYPLAPLLWWFIFIAFYTGQYFYTFTWKHDVKMMARFVSLNWYTSFVTSLANFVVFLTDAAVLHVIKEIKNIVMRKLGRGNTDSDDSNATLAKPKRPTPKRPGVSITESDKSTSMAADDISLDSADFSYYPTNAPGALEENRPYATAVAGLHDDAVMRRVRGNADADSFLDGL